MKNSFITDCTDYADIQGNLVHEFIFIVLFVNLYQRNLYRRKIKNRKKKQKHEK